MLWKIHVNFPFREIFSHLIICNRLLLDHRESLWVIVFRNISSDQKDISLSLHSFTFFLPFLFQIESLEVVSEMSFSKQWLLYGVQQW